MKTNVGALLILIGLLPGCYLQSLTQKESDATPELLAEGRSNPDANCGPNAFRQVVHPQLRAQCAQCHSGGGPGPGAFAIADLKTAYDASVARVDMSAPGSSFLVARSSQAGHGGGGCSNCGATWGATLTSLIQEWAKAERGETDTCQNYLTPIDSGNQGGGPFVLPPYTPPNPSSVTIIAQGLTVFSQSGGVHSLLRTHCAQCHVAGAVSGFAPISSSDVTNAYRETKVRMNFVDLSASSVLSRASTTNHGGGCSSCGQPSLIQALRTQLQNWANIEAQAVETNRVTLTGLATQLSTSTPTLERTLSWSIPNSDGATFSIKLRLATGSTTTYRISDPRITSSSRSIEVKRLNFTLNRTMDPTISTFVGIQTTVAPTGMAGQQLSGSAALMPAQNISSDLLGVSFEVLRAL